MVLWRLIASMAVLGVFNTQLTTCRSPGEQGSSATAERAGPVANVDLPQVDTAALTAREKQDWSSYVGEMLAPCPDTPVSVAECVKASRDCKACVPAARFLAKQVQRGQPRAKIEAAFRLRFAPDTVKSLDLVGAQHKGPADAPVTIVEWADFECPFCRMVSPLLDEKVKAYPGQVRLFFRNYPLSMHPNAEPAARAATAAGLQGKFWGMHDALFENQEDLAKPEIFELARGLGLDLKKFQADWESEAVADAVSRDRKLGDQAGVNGTPTIYINGRLLDLDFFSPAEDLDDWIQDEAEQRTGARPAPRPAASGSAPAPSAAPPGSAAAPAGSGSAAPPAGSARPTASAAPVRAAPAGSR